MKNEVQISVLFALMLMLGLSACLSSNKMIRSDGLKAIKLGEPIPKEGTPKLSKIPLRDSIIIEGEYSWRAVLMEYKGGLVYLEEDFFGSGNLSRVRVETPELKLKNGLRVGKLVADLKAESNKWYIVPLRKYHVFDFYSRTFPRLHFLVDDPARGMADENWEAYQLEQFDLEAKIVAIVVL
ncbi:MAG TPA: hypothetical protein ENJ82_04100 [Bacteroidetes bacterium]|nr:hypothetical protein [Bacteroidota bacterium]